MKRALFLFLIGTLAFVLCTCNSQNNSLEKALAKSGNNRSELEFVLAHYKQNPKDSLKYIATKFLIENMYIHFYYSPYPEYFPILDSLNKSPLESDSIYIVLDSIAKSVVVPKTITNMDLNTLSKEFLITHIDQSFSNWEASPWFQEISFDNFCEFVLPYNTFYEKRENWITNYREKYLPYLNDYLNTYYPLKMQNFCDSVNKSLITKEPIKLFEKGLKNYPPTFADNIRLGSCNDYGARTMYIFRSLGIPVGMDFSPQWINYTTPHSWNILLTEGDVNFPFLGFDETISEWDIEEFFHCPKVFRRTYSIQNSSLALKNFEEQIPEVFKLPNMFDVTSEYVPVSNIEVHLNKNKDISARIVYLCVFNNKEWIPVHWAEVKRSSAYFTDMGRGVLYLPAYYVDDEFVPAGDAFTLDTLGKVQHLLADTLISEQHTLYRKFHTGRISEYPARMLNGVFQGSNDPNFKEKEDLYTIKNLPDFQFNDVDILDSKQFRYIRYVGGKSSFTTVAEIEFYTKKNGKLELLSGNAIGTEGTISNGNKNYIDKVFDGDGLSFFYSSVDSGGWVGLDIKEAQSINKIRYLPKNDDNHIRIDDTYELMYWTGYNWASLGLKTADKHYLEYDNCPRGALFLLRNHTRGIEERIFVMENGKQVWW